MTENRERNGSYISAFVLYLTFFIHGIGVSILGQQVIKDMLSQQWGTTTASVTMVAAALGLGRLITLPFSGPISDKLGRRVSTLIGIASYIVFFLGIAYSPNMQLAYIAAILGGVANSFLDTGVIPACVEILKPRSGLATMLTKLFISIAQLTLPLMLAYMATNNMPLNNVLIGTAIFLAIIGVITFRIPLPSSNKASVNKKTSLFSDIKSINFTKESIALIAIGFTCTATFQLWLNCAQEFGKLSGLDDPSRMQVLYSTGSLVAIIVTAVLVTKIKEIKFIVIYPLISLIMLILVYVFKTPTICLIGSFVIGYSAAGGVLQLATATVNDLFPKIKGTITSIIMIASSLSNYTILSAAGKLTETNGPGSVMLLNIVITAIGVILAIFVNKNYNKLVSNVVE